MRFLLATVRQMILTYTRGIVAGKPRYLFYEFLVRGDDGIPLAARAVCQDPPERLTLQSTSKKGRSRSCRTTYKLVSRQRKP